MLGEIAGPSEGRIVPQVAILESRQKFSTGESCQLVRAGSSAVPAGFRGIYGRREFETSAGFKKAHARLPESSGFYRVHAP